jgi:hypothetical protein
MKCLIVNDPPRQSAISCVARDDQSAVTRQITLQQATSLDIDGTALTRLARSGGDAALQRLLAHHPPKLPLDVGA